MHHTPDLKSKAEILRTMFAEHWNVFLSHQMSLDYVARMEGFKDWQTCSAATQLKQESTERGLQIQPCDDTSDLKLFTGMATVDMCMSAEVAVWAEDVSEAQSKLASFAAELFQQGKAFALDDGNHRDSGDFYFNGSVECVSEPDVEGDDMQAEATWQVDQYMRSASLSRNNPDSANSERRAKVTATFTLSDGFVEVTKTERYEVHGELKRYLYDAIADGDFDSEFEKLKPRLESRIRSERRKLGRRARG